MKSIKYFGLIIVLLFFAQLISCGKKNDSSSTVYKVIFYNYDGTILKEEEVPKNGSATAPEDPVREGYDFVGWNNSFDNIRDDLEIIAQYKKHSHEYINGKCSCGIEKEFYTITFDSNGGSKIGSMEREEGSKIYVVSPTREGYDFQGWFLNGQKWDFHADTVKEDITLVAQWSIKTYTIYFNTNGGEKIEQVELKYDSVLPELKVPSREGYGFIGWDKEIPERMPAKNLVFTAKWLDVLQYYSMNEGTIISYIGNDSKPLIPQNYTLYGHTYTINCIGEKAFYNTNGLEQIIVPGNVLEIKKEAFAKCINLEKVILKNGVLKIGAHAFANCSFLESVTLCKSLISIDEYAFYSDFRLSEITITENIKEIGILAFGRTNIKSFNVNSANVHYKSKNGNLYSYDMKILIHYALGITSTSFTIPEECEKIKPYAFCGAYYLKSVNIPNNMKIISDHAFAYCESISTIVLPPSIVKIEAGAFAYCTQLSKVILSNSIYEIGDNAFLSCNSLTNINIPSSVTRIGECAFTYCSSLTIYCEAAEKNSNWHYNWNSSNRPVVWNCLMND